MATLRDPVAVFVDLQASFCSAEYGFVDARGEAAVDAVIDAVNAFLERYRATGRTPVFVRALHDEADTSPLWAEKYDRRDRPLPCQPDTDGAEFATGLDVRDDDVIVTKHRYDAFYGTPLEVYLSSNDVTELVVGGVATEVCVESTVRSAYDRDYRTTVLADCTATRDPALKADALERIDRSFGTVAESREIELEALGRP